MCTVKAPLPLLQRLSQVPDMEKEKYRLIREQKIHATTATPTIPEINDSIISEELKTTYGIFAAAAIGVEGEQVIENEKLRITVANKGGRITSVILKEYQTYDSLALDLFDADSSILNLQ